MIAEGISPLSLTQTIRHYLTMDRLELLTQREQLMEDIIAIVESQFPHENVGQLEQLLCDAVCNNFPVN